MNPTELKFNIVPIAVMIFGLIVALFLGVFIGGSELLNLGMIFGLVAVIALVAMMRQHIWLLIPLFWGFAGTMLHSSPSLCCQGTLSCCWLPQRASRSSPCASLSLRTNGTAGSNSSSERRSGR